MLFGARLGLDPLTFPKRLPPSLEALQEQGLRQEFAVGATLDANETFEPVVELASPPPATPPDVFNSRGAPNL